MVTYNAETISKGCAAGQVKPSIKDQRFASAYPLPTKKKAACVIKERRPPVVKESEG
jgi:hypothetical protein